MRIALLATAIAAVTVSLPAHAQSDAILGEVRLFAANFCPEGWLDADGRIMSIQRDSVLFTLLNNSYGGDGKTTFALPDLRKAIPAVVTDREKRLRYCIAVRGDYPRRP